MSHSHATDVVMSRRHGGDGLVTSGTTFHSTSPHPPAFYKFWERFPSGTEHSCHLPSALDWVFSWTTCPLHEDASWTKIESNKSRYKNKCLEGNLRSQPFTKTTVGIQVDLYELPAVGFWWVTKFPPGEQIADIVRKYFVTSEFGASSLSGP